jgi:hypothetical protein
LNWKNISTIVVIVDYSSFRTQYPKTQNLAEPSNLEPRTPKLVILQNPIVQNRKPKNPKPKTFYIEFETMNPKLVTRTFDPRPYLEFLTKKIK